MSAVEVDREHLDQLRSWPYPLPTVAFEAYAELALLLQFQEGGDAALCKTSLQGLYARLRDLAVIEAMAGNAGIFSPEFDYIAHHRDF